MRRGVVAGQNARGLVAAFGHDRLVAELAHHVLDQPALHRIVVDDENTLWHFNPLMSGLCRFGAVSAPLA